MSMNDYSATVKNITESVYAAGFMKSKNQYEVYATLNGVIKETDVAEGQPVKERDALAQTAKRNLQPESEECRTRGEISNLESNRYKIAELQGSLQT